MVSCHPYLHVALPIVLSQHSMTPLTCLPTRACLTSHVSSCESYQGLPRAGVGGCSASEHDRSDLFSIYVFIYLDMYHVVGEFGGALESYSFWPRASCCCCFDLTCSASLWFASFLITITTSYSVSSFNFNRGWRTDADGSNRWSLRCFSSLFNIAPYDCELW
jgi:hypothetical protein